MGVFVHFDIQSNVYSSAFVEYFCKYPIDMRIFMRYNAHINKTYTRKENTEMKKLLAILLVLTAVITCAGLTACNKDENESSAAGSTAGDGSTAPKASGNKFGAQAGTTGFYYIVGDPDWDFEGFPNLEGKAYETGPLAVADLKAGNLDYVVIDRDVAKNIVSAASGVKMIDIALSGEELYAIAVDKAQPELLDQINSALAEINVDEIVKKYTDFGGNSADWNGDTFDYGTVDESKEQLVFATNASFAPFEFTVGNKVAGIDIEIASLIAAKLGKELVVVETDFDAIPTSVGKNGIDCAIAGMTVNETRAKLVSFSNSYYSASQVIVCNEDDHYFDDCTTAEQVISKIKDIK